MTELEWAKIFSDKLKDLLDEWGMNQKELSEETGISESTISRCLRGECIPNIKTIVNICYALDCNPEDLMDFYEPIK